LAPDGAVLVGTGLSAFCLSARHMDLNTSILEIARLGSRQRAALASLGIGTVRDLIFHFPFRHDDFTRTVDIVDAPVGQHLTVLARLVKVRVRRSFRRRLSMTEAVIEDDTGQLTALWFNQPYLASALITGQSYRFAGKLTETKLGRRLINPLYEAADKDISAYASPLVPVYPSTSGISQHVWRRLALSCRDVMTEVPEYLPADLLETHRLLPIREALHGIHFPRTSEELAAARRRLSFDELFRLQLFVGRQRSGRAGRQAVRIPFDAAKTREFVAKLPFMLTDDQRRASYEVLQDMGKASPMHRLLDGDVGTGKTVVAAMAMMAAARVGHQTALMAPTEILAKQHFETLKRLFADSGLSVALWTNSYKRAAAAGRDIEAGSRSQASRLSEDIAAGAVSVIVGTHALVEESVRFASLVLAVIDEQHRFGVRVRQLLCQKSGLAGIEPHLLSMTATPIPRSLALTVYGDLDLSLLREKPKDRLPVVTRVIGPRGRAAAYGFMRQEIAAGRQVFIVCPLIDPSDALGAASVTAESERLRGGEFAGIALSALHGQLAAEDKERVMKDFLEKRVMVLVSTSVVEVGVDIPNATVMCIEGAERFGLAQLHQFRGRVGRGEHQSYCFLFPSSVSTGVTERLRAVAETSDGFILAEKDLAMRGPGDLLGREQSGLTAFRVASLADTALIKEAREAAGSLLQDDPELRRHPALRERLDASVAGVHLE